MSNRIPVWVLSIMVVGCATGPKPLPGPLTPTDVQSYGTSRALVQYLSQPNADASVCSPQAKGPHLPPLDADGQRALVNGLDDGSIAPDLWRSCVVAMSAQVSPVAGAALVDRLGEVYLSTLNNKRVETDAALRARLTVMLRFYLARKLGEGGSDKLDTKLFDELRKELGGTALGNFARSFGENLLVAYDAEHGQWHGRSVDVALLDDRFGAQDEKTLTVFTERLPNADLRTEAARRIIRLHIAHSKFTELRATSAQVEEVVLKRGVNAVSLAEHTPTSATLDPAKLPIRRLVVKQNLGAQRADLTFQVGNGTAIQLRGGLSIVLAGVSHPVTVCSTQHSFDPTPCVDANDIHLGSPYARVDAHGGLKFVSHITMAQVLALAGMRDQLVVPISIGDKALATFSTPFSFVKPDDLTLSGTSPGSDGPKLDVAVEVHDAAYVFTVADAAKTYNAVVEPHDILGFHIVSAGADGQPGEPGTSGQNGGDHRVCGSGGTGQDGEDGGPGEPGGNGGNINVNVTCDGRNCDLARDALTHVVVSRAGAGGQGGEGGLGGMGGSGGAGEVTYTDDAGDIIVDYPGCSGGPPGSDGNAGTTGANGAPGQPGAVHFSFVAIAPHAN